ncbi:hypothetical protein QBC37DRAFT_379756 [Rhypophila decipiens]|uniref:BAR domain-containing protein n=1 Tax=Rhypophila decipiens TaxID=261697 RepID=A0AAN6XY60_9PEZI|nr:hypothetical protein QBC37DRAFT_379756 [Rhypophila decipiens]
MNITKKFDRAFQWAGEKMGSEAKTTMSDDFKNLETEMALRFEGMERLQKSMSVYVKWIGRRCEGSEDREKKIPTAFLGNTMISHGEEFAPDSEFGNCLIALGRGNERVAAIQDNFVSEATTTWLESLDRSLAMMKEYQAARKKLENRRLAYDASITKMQKARRDDFRIEEEQRAAKAKYEESSEDVVRRMQDIRDAEVDNVRDLTSFLDAELDYHERCAEELRRVRKSWAASGVSSGHGSYGSVVERRPTGRSRSSTAQSISRTNSHHNIYEADEESEAPPVRMPIRSATTRPVLGMQPQHQQGDSPPRSMIGRASTFQGGASLDRERVRSGSISATTSAASSTYAVNQHISNVGGLRGQLRPVNKIVTSRDRDDVFGDDESTSDSGSPDYRSTSPATSIGSLSRTYSSAGSTGNGFRKAPPPPPPSRSKKPPPPVPARREVGY